MFADPVFARTVVGFNRGIPFLPRSHTYTDLLFSASVQFVVSNSTSMMSVPRNLRQISTLFSQELSSFSWLYRRCFPPTGLFVFTLVIVMDLHFE